jgi:hypothetical protein
MEFSCQFIVYTNNEQHIYIYIYKGKGHPITGHREHRGGVEIYLYSCSTSALGGGGLSAPRPGRFTPGKDPVPIVQEAGWAQGPVRTCAKNIAHTGIRSPERPARIQSLYRLSFLAPYIYIYIYTVYSIIFCKHSYMLKWSHPRCVCVCVK